VDLRRHLGSRHDPAEHGRVADSITNDLDILEWDSPTSDLWIEALYRIQNVLRETARHCVPVVSSQQRRHLGTHASAHVTVARRPSRPTSVPRA
jgi:hypothetical protein